MSRFLFLAGIGSLLVLNTSYGQLHHKWRSEDVTKELIIDYLRITNRNDTVIVNARNKKSDEIDYFLNRVQKVQLTTLEKEFSRCLKSLSKISKGHFANTTLSEIDNIYADTSINVLRQAIQHLVTYETLRELSLSHIINDSGNDWMAIVPREVIDRVAHNYQNLEKNFEGDPFLEFQSYLTKLHDFLIEDSYRNLNATTAMIYSSKEVAEAYLGLKRWSFIDADAIEGEEINTKFIVDFFSIVQPENSQLLQLGLCGLVLSEPPLTAVDESILLLYDEARKNGRDGGCYFGHPDIQEQPTSFDILFPFDPRKYYSADGVAEIWCDHLSPAERKASGCPESPEEKAKERKFLRRLLTTCSEIEDPVEYARCLAGVEKNEEDHMKKWKRMIEYCARIRPLDHDDDQVGPPTQRESIADYELRRAREEEARREAEDRRQAEQRSEAEAKEAQEKKDTEAKEDQERREAEAKKEQERRDAEAKKDQQRREVEAKKDQERRDAETNRRAEESERFREEHIKKKMQENHEAAIGIAREYISKTNGDEYNPMHPVPQHNPKSKKTRKQQPIARNTPEPRPNNSVPMQRPFDGIVVSLDGIHITGADPELPRKSHEVWSGTDYGLNALGLKSVWEMHAYAQAQSKLFDTDAIAVVAEEHYVRHTDGKEERVSYHTTYVNGRVKDQRTFIPSARGRFHHIHIQRRSFGRKSPFD